MLIIFYRLFSFLQFPYFSYNKDKLNYAAQVVRVYYHAVKTYRCTKPVNKTTMTTKSTTTSTTLQTLPQHEILQRFSRIARDLSFASKRTKINIF